MPENKSNSLREKIKSFPESPGVYLMKDKPGKIIYIGKATSLKNRVGSYFTKALDNKTAKLVSEIHDIGYKKTDTVVEALIFESSLVNKYKPKYNIKLKDDKSFVNIIITAEDYPRVLIKRPTDEKKVKSKHIFGPYISKQQAQMVVDLLIKIFAFSPKKHSDADLYRMYYIKGYSSGKTGDISRKDYAKIINNIKLFLEGKKIRIINRLEGEMKKESDKMNFEKAAEIRNQIFSLKHIRDAAFIREDDVLMKPYSKYPDRAEAYDISNISGEFAVGSMIVFSLGKPDKSEYKRFKIKTIRGANDIAMTREVLKRRFARDEWKFPDLLVIDGGIGQKNAAREVLEEYHLKIPIAAIAKGPTRKGEKIFFSAPKGYIFPDVDFIKKMRDEAHRFAIAYHRKLRRIKK